MNEDNAVTTDKPLRPTDEEVREFLRRIDDWGINERDSIYGTRDVIEFIERLSGIKLESQS